MNPSEKRRKELLEQTRQRYRDSHEPPAVHPRYRAAYGQLYGQTEGEEAAPAGTFGIRVFFCMLLFAAFVTMDKQNYKVFDKVDSDRIVKEITTDLDVAKVWKQL